MKRLANLSALRPLGAPSAAASATGLTSSYRASSSDAAPTFVSGLFKRQLNANHMFPYPASKIGAAEQTAVANVLNAINDEKELGALKKLSISSEHGGLALSHTSRAAIMETVGEAKFTADVVGSLHTCTCANLIATFGGESTAAHYLPMMASGEAVFAFAFAEPLVESDISMSATAACLDAHTGAYSISGTKSLRGLRAGPHTDAVTHFLVIARADTGAETRPLTMFIVERKAEGVVVDGSTVTFSGARVAELVGPMGEGFTCMMVSKHSVRYGYDAAMIGTAKGLYSALMEAKAPAEALNYIAALIYGMESALYAVTASMDAKHDDILIDAAFASIAVHYSTLRVIAAAKALAGVSMAGLAPEAVSYRAQLERLLNASEPIRSIEALAASCGVEDFGIEFQAESTFTTMGGRMARFAGAKKRLPLKVSWPEVAQIEEQFANYGEAVEATFIKCGPALRYKQLAMERVAKSGAFIFAASAAVSRAARQEKKETGVFERALCKTLLPILCHDAGALIDEVNKSALAPDGGLVRVVGEMMINYVPISPESEQLKAEDAAKKVAAEEKKAKEEAEKKAKEEEEAAKKKAEGEAKSE